MAKENKDKKSEEKIDKVTEKIVKSEKEKVKKGKESVKEAEKQIAKEIEEAIEDKEKPVSEKTEEIVKSEKEKVKKGKESVKEAEKHIAKEIEEVIEDKEKPVSEKTEEIVESEKEKVKKGKESVKEAEKQIAKEIEEAIEDKGKDSKKKKADKKSDRPKKSTAVVNGKDLHVSIKAAVAICDFIRDKDIDKAIFELIDVKNMKKAIPMRGEIPHRKGKGMMSGRFITKSVDIYLGLLRSLRSNAIYNEIELEKVKIFAVPNIAARPYKRFGQGRFKRSHVTLKLIPITK